MILDFLWRNLRDMSIYFDLPVHPEVVSTANSSKGLLIDGLVSSSRKFFSKDRMTGTVMSVGGYGTVRADILVPGQILPIAICLSCPKRIQSTSVERKTHLWVGLLSNTIWRRRSIVTTEDCFMYFAQCANLVLSIAPKTSQDSKGAYNI